MSKLENNKFTAPCVLFLVLKVVFLSCDILTLRFRRATLEILVGIQIREFLCIPLNLYSLFNSFVKKSSDGLIVNDVTCFCRLELGSGMGDGYIVV